MMIKDVRYVAPTAEQYAPMTDKKDKTATKAAQGAHKGCSFSWGFKLTGPVML